MILIMLQLRFLSYDLNKISKHCHRTLSFFSSVMNIIVTKAYTRFTCCIADSSLCELNSYDNNLSSASKVEVMISQVHQFQL